ncbi:MAG TPA: alpha-2-macroglobulin family protein, partial [Candidatus Dojkabacteria bacterium]|nr:alpha-2-macroglobulin family protein [Candidatus Dojkabacteria bacterium]
MRKKLGEEVKIQVKTVDVQTLTGVPSTIDKIEVVRHWSEKIPRTYYNSTTRTNETTYDYVQHEDLIETQYNLKTDDNGNLELVKKYDQDGSYFFRFEFKDRNNRLVKFYSSLFYLNGDDDDSSIQDNSPIIYTDKSVYEIGDKVNVRVEFPDNFLDGREAYIFVYKDKIYMEEKISITENVYNYSYDLTKELSPQAGIRLVYTLPVSDFGTEFANEKYRVVDSVEQHLVVRRDEDLLNVEISSEKKEYFPGEEVKMKIKVTDENGRSVSGANLNTRVFDKSLLAVLDQDKYQKDIYDKVFGVYKRIGSLFTFPKSPYRGDGGDGGRGPDGIRRNFDDVATFQSNLITDDSGNAELNFTIPDSITTWIVDVDAFTKMLNVGNTFVEISTNKEVIVNGTFPETVRVGDKFSPKVVVYNHTDTSVTGKLVITAGEGLVLSNSEQNIVIEPRTGGIFNFDAEVKQAKSAGTILTIKLLGEDGSVIDGIEKTIEIRVPGFPTTSVESKKLSSGENELKFNIEGDLERTSANLMISPNSYRYAFFTRDLIVNSSEERASSVVHNLAIYENYDKGQSVIPMSKDSILDQSILSIAALLETRNEDGGYGMFGYSTSDIKNTSYVAYALGKGNQSGAGNSYDEKELLTQYLVEQVVTTEGKVNKSTTPYDKTMAVWALSYIDPSKAINYAQMIKSQLNGDETMAELSL